MADPTTFIMKYAGAAEFTAGTSYDGSALDLGTTMQMKTSGVSVSVDGTIGFPIGYDDVAFLNTGATYTFSKDCVVAFGDMTEVT